jgi:hypothetical protein
MTWGVRAAEVELHPLNGFKVRKCWTSVGGPLKKKLGNRTQRAVNLAINVDGSIRQTRPNLNMLLAR